MAVVEGPPHGPESAAQAVGNPMSGEQTVPDGAGGKSGRPLPYVRGKAALRDSGNQQSPAPARDPLPPAAQQAETNQPPGDVVDRRGADDAIDHLLDASAARAGSHDRFLDRMPRPDFTGGAEPSGTQAQHPLLGQRDDGTLDHTLPTAREERVGVPVQRRTALRCRASSP
ncbi:hypothetical protein GCM10010264_37330 [Streptomyces globisporus]|nr:hypothetical protein GCM10010264_37330 [Streptomyces globisporus]